MTAPETAMTDAELEDCLRAVRTLAGRWSDDHAWMWRRFLERYPHATAAAAIDRMAEQCDYPTIAAFTRFAQGRDAPDGVVLDDARGMFVPGTGWLPPRGRYVMPAIEAAREPTDAEVIPIHELQRRWEEARRRIVKHPPNGQEKSS